ncbi:MAG: DNA-protecting protein DprA [Herpetosiphonaceae bacterium]|nr:DNA-protecting protein DprA [Herpetosiphonaceae bacterium]
MDDLLYYLGFNLVTGIGPTRLDRLIACCGDLQAAWEADPAQMALAGLDGRTSASLLHARKRLNLASEFERITARGVRLVSRDDPAYPVLLLQTATPPPLLYVRGTLTPADRWAVAIVGTRKPSTYGIDAARKLAHDLAASGVTVISGLALGIDAVAHQAALQAGGRTIAVLGSGVDHLSPQTNERLGLRIIDQGAVVSEYPLGTQAAASNFPPRNRLISGLALGVMVVEAAAKSGALITVDFALEQNRDVFAVPGSIFSPRSDGTNGLIRKGALLVTSAQDVLEALNMLDTATHQEVAGAVPDTPEEAAVLQLVEAEPRHIDAIGRDSTLSPSEVSATLSLLELKGLVKQVGAMQYVLAREQRASYDA